MKRHSQVGMKEFIFSPYIFLIRIPFVTHIFAPSNAKPIGARKFEIPTTCPLRFNFVTPRWRNDVPASVAHTYCPSKAMRPLN